MHEVELERQAEQLAEQSAVFRPPARRAEFAGLAFISRSSSMTFAAGTKGCTVSKVGAVAASVTASKLLCGS